jgi:hypothetical protein
VKRVGANMRRTGKRYRKKEHWFDEKCMAKKGETKEALRKFEEKDEESRTEYWKSRKACGRTVENEVYLAGTGSRVH